MSTSAVATPSGNFSGLSQTSARRRGLVNRTPLTPPRAALGAHPETPAVTARVAGLWLEQPLGTEAVGADKAEAACLDYPDRLFPKESQKNVP